VFVLLFILLLVFLILIGSNILNFKFFLMKPRVPLKRHMPFSGWFRIKLIQYKSVTTHGWTMIQKLRESKTTMTIHF